MDPGKIELFVKCSPGVEKVQARIGSAGHENKVELVS